MGRFTLYLGQPIRLSALLIEPSHSLIRQSMKSALNGDGFGWGGTPGAARRAGDIHPRISRPAISTWRDRVAPVSALT